MWNFHFIHFNLFKAKLMLTFSKWLKGLLTDPGSSSQAEEKRHWDSLCSTCVLVGGSRVPHWCSQDRAGCRHYRALVYGAGCSKNRDPSQRDRGDVVFAAWWAQGVKHWLTDFRMAAQASPTALISCRSRSVPSPAGPVGNEWRTGGVPLRPVCIQGVCMLVSCLHWTQRFTWSHEQRECWWFVF